jgi:hypothetical protein
VDQSAQREGQRKAQQPQHHQNYEKRPEHTPFSLLR